MNFEKHKQKKSKQVGTLKNVELLELVDKTYKLWNTSW
jgi:hypothetical protein